MGMDELRAQQAQLNRVEDKEVPGVRVRTPRAKMLDARDVQKKHPDKHVRWVSIREDEKAETRKEEGYMRLTAEEGGRQLGKELVLMAIPREVAEQRVQEQKDKNALLMDAHKHAMRAEMEGAVRYLRDQKGFSADPNKLLISE